MHGNDITDSINLLFKRCTFTWIPLQDCQLTVWDIWIPQPFNFSLPNRGEILVLYLIEYTYILDLGFRLHSHQ